jgi:hypothetical protein
MIEIKKANFVEGGYHMIVDGCYIPFDKVVISTTGMLTLYNNERFVCLVSYESEDKVLKLMGEKGIECVSEEVVL